MTRFILTTSLLVLSLTSWSQVHDNAIGIRGGGGNFGVGGEISYQKGFGGNNRLELDLGWRGNFGNGARVIALTGIYHWVMNITDGLNWYVGPGAQLGIFQDKWNDNADLSLGVGGQLGIEFDFNSLDVPLLLSLDIRPMLAFVGSGGSNFGYGGAFGLRYTF